MFRPRFFVLAHENIALFKNIPHKTGVLFLIILILSLPPMSSSGAGEEKMFEGKFPPASNRFDMTAKAHEGWRMKVAKTFVPANVTSPPHFQSMRLRIWDRLLHATTPFNKRELEDFKTIVYYEWLRWEKDGIFYNPESTRRLGYEYDWWQGDIHSILDMMELDPRKEYLDWAVVYCDMLVARKIDREDNLIDQASGRPLTTWHKFHVLNAQGKHAPELHVLLARAAKLKTTDPDRYQRLVEDYKKHLFVTATPMMSGYMAYTLLRTAELIFRHPETHHVVCPDFHLPVRKKTGRTYLEKAITFFHKGLEALEFFSTNPAYWDDRKGMYVSPRNPYLQKIPPEDKDKFNAAAHSPKPWNRAFAILRAQAQAMNMLKKLDPDRYAAIIKRYQSQIDRNVRHWVEDLRHNQTMRGHAVWWAYGKKGRWAEDILHALATSNLLANLYRLGCHTVTFEHLRSVAINFLDQTYVPEEKSYGPFIVATDATEGTGQKPLISTLPYTPYHPEFWPVISSAIGHFGLPGKLHTGYWLKLYKAKHAWLELMARERKRRAKLPPNPPPAFT
ncbi:MAG: hypothetical protein D6820_12325, partial [Lentisphaerae bacterium]